MMEMQLLLFMTDWDSSQIATRICRHYLQQKNSIIHRNYKFNNGYRILAMNLTTKIGVLHQI